MKQLKKKLVLEKTSLRPLVLDGTQLQNVQGGRFTTDARTNFCGSTPTSEACVCE